MSWFQWFMSFFWKPAPPPKYEHKYLLHDSATEDEKYVKLSQVFESTPDGDIVLSYSNDMFTYWANNTIHFKYLETVARKYVLVHNCKHLYIPYTCAIEEIKPAILPPPFHNPIKKSKFILKKITNHYKWCGKLDDLTPKQTTKPIKLSFKEYLASKHKEPLCLTHNL